MALVAGLRWRDDPEMSSQPVLFPVLLATITDPLVRAVAAYLAKFKDATRVHTESDLRAFVAWCAERRLPPLSAQRVHIEFRGAAGDPCGCGGDGFGDPEVLVELQRKIAGP